MENKNVDAAVAESTEDSNAYTEERRGAAQEYFEAMRGNDRRQFEFLGVPEPELEVPAPEDRPIDTEIMTEREVESLERQNEVASEGYQPKGLEYYVGESFESPDINPEAKEFQLKDRPSYSGPEAAEVAYESGFNPRTVATSTNPDDLVRLGEFDTGAEERVEEITDRSADDIREEQGGNPDGEVVDEAEGSGADETVEPVSKSSPKGQPRRVEK